MKLEQEIVSSVAILGGGTAGWMTAAALARALNRKVSITVVESDEIGTVGVGEATIPPIRQFNAMLELDENDFLRETKGTIKLGIEFREWTRPADRYMHGFGRFRQDIQLTTFEQIWWRMNLRGRAAEHPEYSITKKAAYAGKFMRPRPDAPDSPLADIDYAFHFDANLYARYLRRYAEARGVHRVEGKVVGVVKAETSGDISSLALASGEHVEAKFFVDCSGFRGRLIEEELDAGFEDWTHWLPCDRAIAVPCASSHPLQPYTRSTARSAGWQWRIPLQHRTGNGYVYCSRYLSDDEATATLLTNLDGEVLASPRMLAFKAGMRRSSWQRNCVAIGLSSGFLEPLESTSIHLIQSAISRLLQFFPSSTPRQVEIDEFNRLTRREFEHVRDFIVLHYHASQRADAPLWNYVRGMSIPETLQRKIDLFKECGRLVGDTSDLFARGSWFQVMFGQGIKPSGYDPIADVLDADDVSVFMDDLRRAIGECIKRMPTHEEFIQQNCSATAT